MRQLAFKFLSAIPAYESIQLAEDREALVASGLSGLIILRAVFSACDGAVGDEMCVTRLGPELVAADADAGLTLAQEQSAGGGISAYVEKMNRFRRGLAIEVCFV